jgi:predicted transcriptional regulator of viral defense system
MAVQFLIYRLKKNRYIVSVKRGLYMLSDEQISDLYVANKIYAPSYVSLEFALSYHGVIPETVYEITSVTTKATRRFETLGKIFSYRKIKKSAYTGYAIQKQNGVGFYIADAEKAFVDANYLRLMNKQKPISRFHKEKIDPGKALRYAKLFGNARLTSIIKTALRQSGEPVEP